MIYAHIEVRKKGNKSIMNDIVKVSFSGGRAKGKEGYFRMSVNLTAENFDLGLTLFVYEFLRRSYDIVGNLKQLEKQEGIPLEDYFTRNHVLNFLGRTGFIPISENMFYIQETQNNDYCWRVAEQSCKYDSHTRILKKYGKDS